MSERQTIEVRRIVVAVDASPHSQAALRAAVEMAARFRAELTGLFVEDVNMLRVAELPFVHAMGEYSARRHHVATEDIERHFRVRTRQVRRVFQLMAEQQSIVATFRVARGMVASEIQAAAREADVLIVGRLGWSRIRERRLGSTARAACCDEAPSITVLLREDAHIEPPILVIYDGSAIGDKALVLGAALVDETTHPLQILLVADNDHNAPNVRERAGTIIRDQNILHQYQVLTDANVTKLAHAIHASDGGTLILPAKSPILREDAVVDLLEQIDIPVLLVR